MPEPGSGSKLNSYPGPFFKGRSSTDCFRECFMAPEAMASEAMAPKAMAPEAMAPEAMAPEAMASEAMAT